MGRYDNLDRFINSDDTQLFGKICTSMGNMSGWINIIGKTNTFYIIGYLEASDPYKRGYPITYIENALDNPKKFRKSDITIYDPIECVTTQELASW